MSDIIAYLKKLGLENIMVELTSVSFIIGLNQITVTEKANHIEVLSLIYGESQKDRELYIPKCTCIRIVKEDVLSIIKAIQKFIDDKYKKSSEIINKNNIIKILDNIHNNSTVHIENKKYCTIYIENKKYKSTQFQVVSVNELRNIQVALHLFMEKLKKDDNDED